VYFVSVSKLTSNDAGCVTLNERTSDKVMFRFAVCANDAVLKKDANAINVNTFFMLFFYDLLVWLFDPTKTKNRPKLYTGQKQGF
jgi:hypothetical protein